MVRNDVIKLQNCTHRSSEGFLLNVGVHAIVLFLQKLFMIFLFKVTKSLQKAMSKIRIIVCCSKYYQNDFHYQAKASRREAHASDNLALPSISFNSLW